MQVYPTAEDSTLPVGNKKRKYSEGDVKPKIEEMEIKQEEDTEEPQSEKKKKKKKVSYQFIFTLNNEF